MLQKVIVGLLIALILWVVGVSIQFQRLNMSREQAQREQNDRLAQLAAQVSQIASRQAEALQAASDQLADIASAASARRDDGGADAAASLAAERTKSALLERFLRELLLTAELRDGASGTSTRDALMQQALAHAAEIEASDPETAATIRAAMDHALATQTGEAAGAGETGGVAGDDQAAAGEARSPLRSPWPKLSWIDGKPFASWDGPWHEVLRINNIDIAEIMAACEAMLPGKAQQVFTSQLIEAIESVSGEPVGETVSLRLKERETGSITVVPARALTEENFTQLMKALDEVGSE